MIMYPFLFEILGRPISTYGLFMILGAVAAWFLVRLLGGKDRDIPLVFLICICGGLIGAFLLRPITRIPEIFINWEHIRQLPPGWIFPYLFGEIVFYGGLIGGVVAMLLYCRRFNIPVLPIADLFAPALALAHSFGRVGCFFGGCCYGIPVSALHPFAVIYPHPITGQAHPRLAIQLIEAACLLILAVILVIIYKKTAGKGLAVSFYGILYSALRFVIEFYRGDIARGVYGPFSTSQYISIALFIVSVVMLCLVIRRKQT